jgi:hypothetical protein
MAGPSRYGGPYGNRRRRMDDLSMFLQDMERSNHQARPRIRQVRKFEDPDVQFVEFVPGSVTPRPLGELMDIPPIREPSPDPEPEPQRERSVEDPQRSLTPPPPALSPETSELIASGIINFEAQLGQVSNLIPREDFRLAPSRETNMVCDPSQLWQNPNAPRVRHRYAKAMKELWDYKTKGGRFSTQQKLFFRRYRCCWVAEELHHSEDNLLERMRCCKSDNKERYMPTAGIEPQCDHCKVDHPLDLDRCEDALDNGPINTRYLDDDCYDINGSRKTVYIGTRTTLHLSTLIDPVVLNTGIIDYHLVTYPVSISQLERERPGQGTTLTSRLFKRMDKMPTRTLAPNVLLEFFNSAAHPSTKVLGHLVGIMRQIHQMESIYDGTFVLILVLSPPSDRMSQEEYFNYKKEFGKTVSLAKFLGEVFCIAVAPLVVHEVPIEFETWVQRNRSWNREPIFGADRTLTREFHVRVAKEIQRILNAMDRVPGPRDLRG